MGGSLGYVAVWESEDGGEGESMKSVDEEYRLSTAAKARISLCGQTFPNFAYVMIGIKAASTYIGPLAIGSCQPVVFCRCPTGFGFYLATGSS